MHLKPRLIALAVFTIMVSVTTAQSIQPADWLAWQQKRLNSIWGTNGWANLAGLHWLREGNNFAGSDSTNSAILPAGKVPGAVGNFIRSGTNVMFVSSPGVIVDVDGAAIQRTKLVSDAELVPTKLIVGDLSIIAIQRADRMGLRVRDLKPVAQEHEPLPCFPYDPAWRIEGRFAPFLQPKIMRVQDVTGGLQEYASPGAISFKVNGNDYTLDVALEPGETDFFIMFQDLTTGKETYGAGRFMYVSPPDANGRLWIDFNRSYTPPCGFTPYATCPLPPKQNRLPIAIRAGELRPKNHPEAGH